jgi:D-glycero-D-manno-heptose 1,7-bisphosphate phosphatase
MRGLPKVIVRELDLVDDAARTHGFAVPTGDLFGHAADQVAAPRPFGAPAEAIVPDALRALRDAGYALALVTNQSGVGRGYFTLDDVHVLHEYVRQQLAQYGVTLDAIAVCPHAPDGGCECRKPRTGMARHIETQFGEPIAYGRSWVVGDKVSDLEFGRAPGTQACLLRSRYWEQKQLQDASILIADSLYQAAQAILARSGR